MLKQISTSALTAGHQAGPCICTLPKHACVYADQVIVQQWGYKCAAAYNRVCKCTLQLSLVRLTLH